MARDLFHLINKLRELHAVKDFVPIYVLEDPIKNTEWDNCSPFQLYVFEELFGANAESKYLSTKSLQKHHPSAFERDFFTRH